MTADSVAAPTCQVVRPSARYDGKQGLTYDAGISAESVGAQHLCMHLLTIPPGARARAHLHQQHETAIYVLSGAAEMWYGAQLEQHCVIRAGELLFIPAGVPHLPFNPYNEPTTAVLARSDPNEQESVLLLPDLEPLRAEG
ncbi:MAG: cupin domain-containing protein [Chloroflexales bacterium]|nr:cupin domain-containing protein [Chloroflexales bacterium]